MVFNIFNAFQKTKNKNDERERENMGLLSGKKGLIIGVSNDKSIAWAISEQAHKEGADLAFTYYRDSIEKRLRPLAEGIGSDIILECNVTDEEQIEAVMKEIGEKWGKLDFIVHSVAFSKKDGIGGRYINASRDNFVLTMETSCYSLQSLARIAEPYMNEGGSILALSYYGAEKVVRNYNLMGVAKAALEASVRYLSEDMGSHSGVRVNALSAGPIKTLAASGIAGFNAMLEANASVAPLRRNVSLQDVGKSALYLLSDLSSGVTGEIHYVDCGANIMGAGIGLMDQDAAKEAAEAK